MWKGLGRIYRFSVSSKWRFSEVEDASEQMTRERFGLIFLSSRMMLSMNPDPAERKAQEHTVIGFPLPALI
jgi:hypothetical protein